MGMTASESTEIAYEGQGIDDRRVYAEIGPSIAGVDLYFEDGENGMHQRLTRAQAVDLMIQIGRALALSAE